MTNSERIVARNAITDEFDERSIDILVSLAKNGEIDPWDIDVVDVTDKFLARLFELERLDLRISSRTLLFASILIRLKSDALEESESEDADYDEPLEEEQVCFPVLKPKVRRHAKRRVTLSELIQELKKATQRKEKSDSRRLRQQHQANEFDALTVAHTEDIERQVKRVRRELKKRFVESARVRLSELIVDGTAENIIETYIPLLFMATRRQILLEQQEFFGDIFITCKSL